MSVGEIIIPTSFDSLPATQVLRSEQLLGALWSSADNTVDVRTGALQSLVLQPFATLLEASREAFRLGGQQSDLNYLSTADPSDERVSPLLDSLAANYRITRKIGTAAAGVLRLVFSRRATISVSPSDVFTANGLSFIPVRQFTADSREGFTGGNTHFYSMHDDSGCVFFDVEVVALRNGAAGNLVRGVEVLSESGNIPFFVRAFAAETFTGGSDNESNHSLIQRMIHGVSAKVLSSRTNMHASLLENFPTIRDSSVIGVGDIEMTRDQHTVFPGSTGGYVDWYIATTRQLQTATYEFTHFRKLAELSDQSQYAIDLVEDQFPCLYWVSDIVDEATNEPCFVYEQRKYKVEGDVDSPRIHENEEAMFTAYQSTEVQFLGPHDLQSIKVSGTGLF